MKANNKFGFVSAIALASVVGFSACSENELAEANQGERETVKTQFAISVTNKANKTRMTVGQAQEENVFQGIKDIRLYQYQTASISTPVKGTDQSIALTSGISDINTGGGANGFNYQNSGNTLNTKVYNNVNVATNVNHFLFYGETMVDGNEGMTDATWAAADGLANTTKFSPVSIYTKNGTGFDAAMTDVLDVLNTMYTELGQSALPASVKDLQKDFQKLTTASSVSICKFVEDIYNNIDKQFAGLEATDAGYDAINALMTHIKTTFNVTGANPGEKTLEWITDPNFPTAWGLPAGAVGLTFESGQFKVADSKIGNPVTGDMVTAYKSFVFPASLFYYVNTASGVRNASYFDVTGAVTNATASTWANVTANFTNGAVAPTTRSIILWDQVQYGVARLETTVQFKNATILDSKNNNVEVDTENFYVTGVLVGNQRQVDWEFKQNETATAYTIYDGKMTSTTATTPSLMYVTKTAPSAANHTLVYESKVYNVPTDAGASVNVAIEMVNNSGKDFYGAGEQVIPAGGTFYLVAKLDPSASGVINPDETKIKSVFKQDYVTIAKLTISSLANAYNVIPDLTTAVMELGLSVDLGWSEGMVFDVPIP